LGERQYPLKKEKCNIISMKLHTTLTMPFGANGF